MKVLIGLLMILAPLSTNVMAMEPESVRLYYVNDKDGDVTLTGYSIEGKVKVHEVISLVGSYTEASDTFKCDIYSCDAEYKSYSTGVVYREDLNDFTFNNYLVYSSSTTDVSLKWEDKVYKASTASDGWSVSSEILYNYGDSLDLGVRIASGEYIVFTEYSVSNYSVGVSSTDDYFNVYLGYRFGG